MPVSRAPRIAVVHPYWDAVGAHRAGPASGRPGWRSRARSRRRWRMRRFERSSRSRSVEAAAEDGRGAGGARRADGAHRCRARAPDDGRAARLHARPARRAAGHPGRGLGRSTRPALSMATSTTAASRPRAPRSVRRCSTTCWRGRAGRSSSCSAGSATRSWSRRVREALRIGGGRVGHPAGAPRPHRPPHPGLPPCGRARRRPARRDGHRGRVRRSRRGRRGVAGGGSGAASPTLDAEVRDGWTFEGDVEERESLERSLRAALALEDVVARHRLDGGAFNCHVPQFRFGDEIGIAPCWGLGRLTYDGHALHVHRRHPHRGRDADHQAPRWRRAVPRDRGHRLRDRARWSSPTAASTTSRGWPRRAAAAAPQRLVLRHRPALRRVRRARAAGRARRRSSASRPIPTRAAASGSSPRAGS